MRVFLGRFLALLPWYKPYLPTKKPKSFRDIARIAANSPHKKIAESTTTFYTWNAKGTRRNRRCRVCCLFVGAKATECWRGHAL
jgi:hypothetical protein